MDYNKFIVLVLYVFLFNRCDKVDNSEDVEVIRFEKEFYESDDKNLDSIINKYPFLFPNQFSKSIWLEKKNDSTEIDIYKKSLEVFDDFQFNSPKLKLIFKNAKKNFNSFQRPKLISLISLGDYNDKILYTDSMVLVSLNYYYGSNYYPYLPKYISKKMDKSQIFNDIAHEISKSYVKKNEDRTLLSEMIYKGKVYYINKILNPYENDTIIFNSTEKKIKWANLNELEIWTYFIQNELFYNTDIELRSRFLSLTPYSKFNLDIDMLSPGNIGGWLGYKIVSSYVKKNNINLEELINLDHYTIFKNSKYKPSKK
ncbi:MAG: hypothetical protein ISP56_00240 [Flavobacteriaceae bacterium]|nr:hypothetical protein [Flavobacteriaceae bacterium]